MELRLIRDFVKNSARAPHAWMWLAAVLLSGFLAYYLDIHGDIHGAEATAAIEPEPVESAATFIPAGYVLVPIEVANFEALDSILGKFGIVDLYVPGEGAGGDTKAKSRKVGHRLRILRAPLNPSRFAVLVREEESARLVSHAGAYTVVIQNSKQSGTGLVTGEPDTDQKSRARRSRITVEVSGEKAD